MRKLVLIVVVAVVAAAVWILWPQSRQTLVLYNAVDYGPAVARAFTKKTGIQVTVITTSTGPLIARVSAEAARPQWTLAWFDGATAAAGLDKAGLVAEGVLPKVSWNSEGRKLLPSNGAYVPTGYTLSGVFAYRRDGLAPPANWQGLLTPAYRNAVGMNNPAVSGPTYPLLAGMLQTAGGWPQGQKFMLALKQNGLQVYRTNSTTLAALKSGEIKIAMVQSSAAYYLADKPGSDIAVSVPDPAFILPRVMIEAPHLSSAAKRAAAAFIRFVMSPEGQALAMSDKGSDGLYWPVINDVPADKRIPDPATLHLESVPPSQWGPLESTINQWFTRTVLGQ
ncbi:hypothetical protein BJI67_01325 [Acidihalobacter aeolianus]|uniref:Iron ABC transporter substrate-binding protein n=1 Tax=Acidihalobacter aeolianus TaxID=2792603 RepID=A0A1D8K4K7_9GAMM|nr:extracellular solute-binding protein [Acidihalobacter aeolianus]AOV15892.1 hypothetical protein BJI67_01325 [Acidihalobacter aeolianus]